MGLENGPASSFECHFDRTEMVVAIYHKISILDRSARSIGLRGLWRHPRDAFFLLLTRACCSRMDSSHRNMRPKFRSLRQVGAVLLRPARHKPSPPFSRDRQTGVIVTAGKLGQQSERSMRNRVFAAAIGILTGIGSF